ncbi:MAG: ABC transporter permease [Candidatus Tectomicrobia bacterium]|nr:ABC transporter permease [Candidatus Tectomicrobia bacterium]
MEVFFFQLLSGLAIGCIYGLIALGFSMIYRAMNLLNFAQGEIVTIGGLIGYTCLASLRLSYSLTFLVTFGVCALLGVVMELTAFRPLRRRQAGSANLVIASIGVAIILSNLGLLLWGAEPLAYPPVLGSSGFLVGAFYIDLKLLLVLFLGLAFMAALQLFLKQTMVGIAMRAAAQIPLTARLHGIALDRMIMLNFAISGVLGAAAGLLFSPLYFASSEMGSVGIKAFAAAVFGGLGNLPGAILGGLFLGLMETFGTVYVSSGYKDALAYGLMIVILLFFPSGLLGRRGRSKEQGEGGAATLPQGGEVAGALRGGIAALAVLILLLLPQLTGRTYFLHITNLAMIYAIVALGLQLICGFAGLVSLGQAAFLGAGAYTSALVSLHLTSSYPLAFLAAMLCSGLLGAVMSFTARLRGHYFAVATLAFGIILQIVFRNWMSLTRGPMGLPNVPHPRLFGMEVRSEAGFFYLILAVLLATYIAFELLVHSRFGRTLRAINENPLAAEVMGVHLMRYKCKVIIAGSLAAGAAGSLFGHFHNYVSPEPFSFWQSVLLLTMIVVGGLGSLPGAIAGSFIVVYLSEFLRELYALRMILYGVALVLLMIYLPGGVSGLASRLPRLLNPAGRRQAQTEGARAATAKAMIEPS